MSNEALFRTLVPDAPLFRRTDRDAVPTPEVGFRIFNTNFMLETPVQPGLQSPSLVSSYAGKIEKILFAFPSWAIADARYADAYKSVIEQLRAGTAFVVVHHDDDAVRTTIESWFDAAGHAAENVTFVPLAEYISFTDWAEDAYVALADSNDGTTYLMEPWEFPRAGDALIAEAVQEYTDVTAHQAPLVFQGGNCLIGDDFWLLGRDYFADTIELISGGRPPVSIPSGTTPEGFARQLFSDYVDSTRSLTLIGTKRPIPLRGYYGSVDGGRYFLDVAADGVGTFQPIFHIDMLITLAGRNASGDFDVLVGDPNLADQALGRRSPYSLAGVYDGIAADLTASGLRVHRNPLVHWPSEGRRFSFSQLEQIASQPGNQALATAVAELRQAGAQPATEVTVRSWHHITWNNCLVERYDGGAHVYLPTFGHGAFAELAALDDQMEQLWQGLGFEVHRLGDFNPFASRQGVVHCIKKYLQRSV